MSAEGKVDRANALLYYRYSPVAEYASVKAGFGIRNPPAQKSFPDLATNLVSTPPAASTEAAATSAVRPTAPAAFGARACLVNTERSLSQ